MPPQKWSLPRQLHLCVWTVLAALVLIPSTAKADSASHSAAASVTIETIGKGAVPLNGPWQFHLGDDLSWAQSDVDDTTGHSGWEALTADAPWGTQGHASYVGFAWYRKHISLSVAPGAPSDIALMIPAIDHAYELYWNGTRIGGLGSMPPHMDFKHSQPPQTYGLGPIRTGVLAVRVYKVPLSSVDDGTGGGFEATPYLGSPQAIALLKTAGDYRWMQRIQFRFGLVTLYVLTSLLSFLAWLRDRRQRLLLCVSAFTFMPLLELILNGLRLPMSSVWAEFFIQTAIQLREISQWFLLVYLLQLEDSTKLFRFLRITACVTVVAGALDGALGFCFNSMSVLTFTIIDAVFTCIMVPVEAVPVALVLIALFRRKHLDHARWLVAIFAFASGTWYAVSNFAFQGIRYTHWTLSPMMGKPLFTLFGSVFNVQTILRTSSSFRSCTR